MTYIKIDGDTILLSNIVNSFPNDSVLRNACIEVTEFSTFVIDVGFEFCHSSFLMNAGSQILITTSDIAQFSSNTFRGDIYMWRGIKTIDGVNFLFGNNDITDAEVALNINELGTYTIGNNHFASNRISVQCLGNPSVSSALPLNISYNDFFTMNYGMLLPYIGQQTDVEDVPFAAIYYEHANFFHNSSDCSTMYIRDHAIGTIFKSCGIVDMELLFCENIINRANVNYSLEGYGIYAIGTKTSIITHEGFDETADSYPGIVSFLNVDFPVHIEDYNYAESKWNRMDIVDRGFYSAKTFNTQYNENKILSFESNGIEIELPKTIVKVQENYINSGYEPNSDAIGIHFKQGYFGDNTVYSIAFNNIDMRKGFSGIYNQSNTDLNISANHVSSLFSTFPPPGQIPQLEKGIFSEGGNHNSVNHNLVDQTALHPSSAFTGIEVKQDMYSFNTCNEVSNFFFGMQYSDNCQGSFIARNRFLDSGSGLRAKNNTVLGTQPMRFNEWTGSYWFHHAEHLGNFNDVKDSKFIQRNIDQANNTIFWPDNHNPQNFFIHVNGNQQPSDCAQFGDGTPDLPQPLVSSDSTIAETAVEENSFVSWSDKFYLYSKLSDREEQPEGIFRDFYDIQYNSTIGIYVRFIDEMESAFSIHEIESNEVSQINSDIIHFVENRKDIYENYRNGSVDSTDFLTLLFLNQENIDSLSDILKGVKSNIDQRQSEHIQDLLFEAPNLPASLLEETLFKNLFIFQLKDKLGQLTSADISQMELLGQTCLLDGGFAVLWIDALYEIKTGNKLEQHQCEGAEERSAMLKRNEIIVTPNPASNIVLVQIEDIAKDETITVHDMTGRVLINKEISTGTNSISIDISTLKSGIYIISVGNSTAKLIVK